MISWNRIWQGNAEEFARHYLESIPPVEANTPGTMLQAAYTNKQETEAIILRVFKDGQAMDAHLESVDRRSYSAYEYIEPTAFEIYASPSAKALSMIRPVVGNRAHIND